MKDEDLLERITLDAHVLVGKPIINGTRLPVEFILSLLAHGATEQEILDEYKGLCEADIRACFLFAAKALESAVFMPSSAEPT
jgi:uncharacterized protein (DUF433 family)